MDWNLDKKRPICPQICEKISVDIASGELEPSQRLYSVRELALRFGVNPNTVQKAYEQLETQGLIHSVRGSGWYVGNDTQTACYTVQSLVKSKTELYIRDLQQLGYSIDDIIKVIKECNCHE